MLYKFSIHVRFFSYTLTILSLGTKFSTLKQMKHNNIIVR